MTRAQVLIPRTAVVPAAGLGTRFLPATKTVPKELLPVVDTPGIELVAAEAAQAGGERLIIVTSEGKDGVVAHFVEDLILEGTLEARGKHVMLEKVRRAHGLIKVESVVQLEPLGLGHAVGCVEPVLLPDEDAIAVLLPDDLVLPTGVLETMSKVRAKRGGSVLCEIEVTDAIALLINEGHPVHVVVHRGSRHDLGNPGGYLKAAVDFALERDDYGPELRRWLVERLGLIDC